MSREKLPLIRPPQPLWAKASWTAAAAGCALFLWLKVNGGGLPECDSDAARSGLSDLLKATNLEATSASNVKTVSTTKDAVVCSGAVAKGDGGSVPIEYRITFEGKAPKVEITQGEDQLAAAAADSTEAPTKVDPPSPEESKKLCEQEEDGDARIAACGRVIESAGESPDVRAEAHVLRGDAYSAKGDSDQALADYDEAIALGAKSGAALAKHAAVFSKRGAIFAAKGEHAKAIADYSAAIRVTPKNAPVYDARACEEARAGALAKAEADIKQAKKLGRANPGAACQAELTELRAKSVKRKR